MTGSNKTVEEFELEYQHLKLCAARSVYHKQNELLPPNTPHGRITWRRWWEKMFKESYLEYTRKMSRARNQV